MERKICSDNLDGSPRYEKKALETGEDKRNKSGPRVKKINKLNEEYYYRDKSKISCKI